MPRQSHEDREQQDQNEKDLQEMLENYRAVKKLGKWAVGIVVFFGAVLYAVIELKRFIK